MSRFLFVTWDGAGNQPPATGIAQELRDRGHNVVFAGYESQRPRFAERDFPFVVLDRSEAALEQVVRLGDFKRAFFDTLMLGVQQLDEIPELFAREYADFLVVDCMQFGALTAAEAAHLPAAVYVHSAPGALFADDGGFGRAFLPSLNALRDVAGLPGVERTWDTWRGRPVFCVSVPQLDPLASEVPAEFQWVGPVYERVPPSGRELLGPDDGRPLVLVSFSTSEGTAQGARPRLERTLAALASLPCRVLVTSSQADVSGLAVPENAVLVRRVPHVEVLPHACITVTHAGHGTTIASLAHGVPLVCLPNQQFPPDQTPLARQVETLGAGRALDGDNATPAEIRDAVHEVLTNPVYRERARGLAESMSAMPGAAGVASRLEQLTAG